MQMFASGRYSVAHYLIHAMPPVSANAYMHFERNFLHGHVQLYCLTQWILTRAGHPKITSRWDGTGRNGRSCGTEHRRQCEGLQHWRGRDNPNMTHSRAESSFKDEGSTILPKPLFRALSGCV